MRRTTLAVVILASAACGIDVVGLGATTSEIPSTPDATGPTTSPDGSTPGAPDSGSGNGSSSSGGGGGGGGGGGDSDAAPSPKSSLTLTHTTLPTSANVNLTTAGAVDWVNWGKPKTRKSTSAQAIVNLTTQSSADCTVYDFPCSLTWSDGTNPATFSGPAGRCIFASNAFYAFDVLATTKPRTLTLLFGAYQAKGKITVSLSDGTPAQTDDSLDNKTESMATIQYTVTFSAAAASGTTLHVDWRDESQRPQGSVYLGTAAVHE